MSPASANSRKSYLSRFDTRPRALAGSVLPPELWQLGNEWLFKQSSIVQMYVNLSVVRYTYRVERLMRAHLRRRTFVAGCRGRARARGRARPRMRQCPRPPSQPAGRARCSGPPSLREQSADRLHSSFGSLFGFLLSNYALVV